MLFGLRVWKRHQSGFLAHYRPKTAGASYVVWPHRGCRSAEALPRYGRRSGSRHPAAGDGRQDAAGARPLGRLDPPRQRVRERRGGLRACSRAPFFPRSFPCVSFDLDAPTGAPIYTESLVKCLPGVRSGGGATASYRSLPTPTSRTSSGPTTRPAATRCRAEMLRAIGSSWSGLGRSRSSARGGDHARS